MRKDKLFCPLPGKKNWICRLLLLIMTIGIMLSMLPMYAVTDWPSEEERTNIVAVVDCSTSMQSSDATWKIPESLMLLTDMVDDKNIYLSLVVYGTQAEIAFQDMPLGDENSSLLKEQITAALMQTGYNRGQTDTGAALMLVQQFLEEGHAEESNVVLLFTDGAVKATANGRSDEISRHEIDCFAAWAQNNGVCVHTLGLFHAAAEEAAVSQAEQELAILKSKTGGMYQRVSNAADIPDFVRSILAQQLDCQNMDLKNPQEVEDAQEGHGWQYTINIPDQYVNDVTLVWPSPECEIRDIRIEGACTEGETISAADLSAADWYSYTRYNAQPGYSVLRLRRLSAEDWQGEYRITVWTNQTECPQANGFYRYDVEIHVELDSDTIQVMEKLPIQVYLTDKDGYRIDDLEYLQGMAVEMTVVNLESRTATVREEGSGEEFINTEQTEEKKGLLQKLIKKEMNLQSDCFRTEFQPQFASEYRLTVQVSNESFHRSVTTQPLYVTDSLQVVSNVVTAKPHKNQKLEVRAYLQQADTFTKVTGTEYYRLAGASVVFNNMDTGMSETVPMEEKEDGNGLSAVFVPTDAGRYAAYVVMESHQENVRRKGETMTFEIEDRPVELRSWFKLLGSSRMLESLFRGYYSGRTITIDGDRVFYDRDGDAFRMDAEIVQGDAEESLFDNVYQVTPHGRQRLQLHLSALDDSGNTAETTVNLRILSIFEVIVLVLFLILLIVLALAILFCLWQYFHQKKNALQGVLQAEVWLNGAELNAVCAKQGDGVPGRILSVGRFLLELDNKAYANLECSERLLKKTTPFGNPMAYQIELSAILRCVARRYRNALGREDGVYEYLKNVAGIQSAAPKKVCLVGCGSCFRLKNVRRRSNTESAFVSVPKLDKLTKCYISLPVNDKETGRELTNSCTQVIRAYGLTIEICYFTALKGKRGTENG